MRKPVWGVGLIVSTGAILALGFVVEVAWKNQVKPIAAHTVKASRKVNAQETGKATILGPQSAASVARQYARLPLAFEPNLGQVNSEVNFLARGDGYALFLTPNEASFALSRPSANRRVEKKNSQRAGVMNSFLPDLARLARDSNFLNSNQSVEMLRMKLAGANTAAQMVAMHEMSGHSNYFRGNNPHDWRTNIPNYNELKVEGVYPGVNLLYHGNHRQLEFDFVVKPGYDSKSIQLEFQGADHLSVDSTGDLVLNRKDRKLRFHRPVAYQLAGETSPANQENPSKHSESRTSTQLKKNLIASQFVIKGKNRVGFWVGEYDRNKELVIDPTLSYSTFLGGAAADLGTGITVDNSGNAYIVGQTCSTSFPTAAPLQAANAGNCDAFVTKLNASGSAIVFSTFLGGTHGDLAGGVAIDSAENVYVTGLTNSTDFPTTVGAFQTTYGGGNSDVFITKLNPTGSALVYSTYLGGSDAENGAGIAVDSNGNAIVTGQTCSIDLPTLNAFQPVNNGNCDAFVSKLNASGSALVYSTYLGGSDIDAAYGIAVDSLGAAFVTGSTISPCPASPPAACFPVKNSQEDEFDGPPDFPGDAFVSKLAADGSLVYSSYLGGSGQDAGYAIAVDSLGIAYITGATNSTDLIPTFGAFQQQNAGKTDAFVTKLNTQGAVEIYNTLLGGSDDDLGLGIAVDLNGNAYVTGSTKSTNFPTANPEQTAFGGGPRDAFVAKLNPSGTGLIFSTYLGGAGDDAGNSIAVDSSGNMYVTGTTASVNFPTTAGALQATNAGNGDAFVTKIANVTAPVPLFNTKSLNFADQTVGTSSTVQAVTLTNAGDAALSIIGIQASGDFGETNNCGTGLAIGANCTISVSFTPTAVGVPTGSLSVTDNAANSPQAITLTGNAVIPPPDFTISASPASATVPAGKSAAFTLSVSPIAGFAQPINLTCAGAPPRATCSFSSSSVTPSGAAPTTVTVTVATDLRTLTPPSSRYKLGPLDGMRIVKLLPVWLTVLIILFLLSGLRRELKKTAFGLAVILLLAAVGCNSGSQSGVPAGTPAGTYQIIVTGTSGAISHTTMLNLQVN
jgi:beta-propeller repeat-containing protein/HYDIN/CFA65/VesB family protein